MSRLQTYKQITVSATVAVFLILTTGVLVLGGESVTITMNHMLGATKCCQDHHHQVSDTNARYDAPRSASIDD